MAHIKNDTFGRANRGKTMSGKLIQRPVIFNFQPTEYKELTTPKELKQWEDDMKEKVGIPVDHSNLAGTCCESMSGGRKDDCDED